MGLLRMQLLVLKFSFDSERFNLSNTSMSVIFAVIKLKITHQVLHLVSKLSHNLLLLK